jgi:hypothetical protein
MKCAARTTRRVATDQPAFAPAFFRIFFGPIRAVALYFCAAVRRPVTVERVELRHP